jgi:hypothetical protein
MTTASSRQFRWSDAWLFESISVACAETGVRAPLAEVLRAADGVNKTPISFQELNGGVSRLERAGYVTLHEDVSLSLTPAGMTLLTEARAAWSRERLSFMEAVERVLGAVAWTRNDDPRAASDDRELISPTAL